MESPACGKTVRRILRKARDGALLSLLMPAHAALQTGADIYNSPTARIPHTTSITVRFGRRDSTDAGGPWI